MSCHIACMSLVFPLEGPFLIAVVKPWSSRQPGGRRRTPCCTLSSGAQGVSSSDFPSSYLKSERDSKECPSQDGRSYLWGNDFRLVHELCYLPGQWDSENAKSLLGQR